MHRFSIWLLSLFGWKVINDIPAELRKFIIAVAPHTSWKDFFLGLVVRPVLRRRAYYLGKKDLFDSPLGFFFRWTGGKPVDRKQKTGLVEQVASLFAAHDDFVIAIAPEGTRNKVSDFKTGFYFMARGAGVPIVPCLFDYEHKTVHFLAPFYLTSDTEADLNQLWNFYRDIKGARPEKSISGTRLTVKG